MNFDEIYAAYRNKIERYVRRLGHDDAEDITQEIFIRVNESLPKFRGDSSVETWLYRIATNMSIDRRRSAEYKRMKGETLTGDDIVSNAIYEDVWSRQAPGGLEREIIKKEMIDCIADYINQMNENFRNVIVLSEFEKVPDAEIATILNITIENVRIRLVRARKQLKKVLSENCSINFDEDNNICCEPR